MRAADAGHAAARLAGMLVDHVRRQQLVDPEALADEPADALKADTGVEVVWLEPATLPPGCSVAAGYDRSSTPARLLVARDASHGRRRFSLLHEYAHHLRDQVPDVLDALFAAPEAGLQLEERVCDEFAAQVLLPEAALQPVLSGGVTARAVLALISATGASAQACAVAAARHLPAPGYVLLLGPKGESLFAARSGDALPVARGTAQQGLLLRAAAGLALRDRASVTYATGNTSTEMFCDIASAGNLRVAVFVTDSAPWGALSLGAPSYQPPAGEYCDGCGAEFVSYNRPCALCSQRNCPTCGRCACERTVRGERACDRCFALQPPAAFPSPTGSTCTSCQ